jgi:hypothetical protein
MFGFGKRTPAAAQPVQVQVIPAELWQDDIGQAMRDAGMRPDDPANIVTFANAVDARVAQARVALELRVQQENAEIARAHPGCSLAPMHIFTEMVWNGPHRRLLLETLELTPYDQWNVRLVAADQRSVEMLKLPRIYAGEIPKFQDSINNLLAQLEAEHRAAANFKHDMTRDIWGLSNYFWEEQIRPGLGD